MCFQAMPGQQAEIPCLQYLCEVPITLSSCLYLVNQGQYPYRYEVTAVSIPARASLSALSRGTEAGEGIRISLRKRHLERNAALHLCSQESFAHP